MIQRYRSKTQTCNQERFGKSNKGSDAAFVCTMDELT